jgi:hypothetical protein
MVMDNINGKMEALILVNFRMEKSMEKVNGKKM